MGQPRSGKKNHSNTPHTKEKKICQDNLQNHQTLCRGGRPVENQHTSIRHFLPIATRLAQPSEQVSMHAICFAVTLAIWLCGQYLWVVWAMQSVASFFQRSAFNCSPGPPWEFASLLTLKECHNRRWDALIYCHAKWESRSCYLLS